ncbi:unnamed protein product [Prunus brigantina]
MLNNIVNFVDASAKRHSELKLTRQAEIEDLLVAKRLGTVIMDLPHQEVPLVNAFLTGVKIDAGVLARTKATDFSDRLMIMYVLLAFGDMYLTLARHHSETTKAATTEAQATLQERNALQLKEQFGWEKLVVRFNPDLDINFDTSGVLPPIPYGRELLFVSPSSGDATRSPDA